LYGVSKSLNDEKLADKLKLENTVNEIVKCSKEGYEEKRKGARGHRQPS
jgi:hypothetical protein